MKLVIVCNMIPGVIRTAMGQKDNGGGLWLDHVLSDLMKVPEMSLMVLCRGNKKTSGKVSESFAYSIFEEAKPQQYYPELEAQFVDILASFRPDVIHIWGTEYGHTLAMVNAAEKEDLLAHVAVSIQGLISECATCYDAGLPSRVVHQKTIRDLIRHDNIAEQQKVFRMRGYLEVQAISKVCHVIGRTHFDEQCTKKINPHIIYHFCNETLRNTFYSGQWVYTACKKHSVFVSSCSYPLKGFHFLLEAFPSILEKYPDATISVPGKGYYLKSLKDAIRKQAYQEYLTRLTNRLGLKDKVFFVGHLTDAGMKKQMLEANVFVLPSVLENSPNSLGEAMLLGVPCVASDVGGVSTMITPEEGIIVRDSAELAQSIMKIFAMQDKAEEMGKLAKKHASMTHNPEKNLETLLEIYKQIALTS